MSDCEGFLDVREAKVFDRGLNGEDDCGFGELRGDVGEGRENAGCEGDKFMSDDCECDRDDIGTIRFWRFGVDDLGDPAGVPFSGSSGGTSSAAGMGRPLAAATN